MARLKGARNRDHAETKTALLQQLTVHVLRAGGQPSSLRELAKVAEVDPQTLRHYFKDREGLVAAIFESMLGIGQARRQMALGYLTLPVGEALRKLLMQLCEGWTLLLGGLHALGFAEGMADAELGQSYVANILEPTLVTFEEILTHYHARGALAVPSPRVGALALVAPVVLALFHQHQLSGRRCRPLDFSVFVEAHLTSFLQGYAA